VNPEYILILQGRFWDLCQVHPSQQSTRWQTKLDQLLL